MSRTQRQNRKTGKPERDSYHRRTHALRSCSHGGDCPWCLQDRLYGVLRQPPLQDELGQVPYVGTRGSGS